MNSCIHAPNIFPYGNIKSLSRFDVKQIFLIRVQIYDASLPAGKIIPESDEIFSPNQPHPPDKNRSYFDRFSLMALFLMIVLVTKQNLTIVLLLIHLTEKQNDLFLPQYHLLIPFTLLFYTYY